MKNEITKIDQLKGKKISNLKLDCGELWLKFTDNTFAVLVVNDITEPFGYNKNEVNINQYIKDETDYALVDLGLISEKEYKEACDKEEIEYQKRQDERNKKEEERVKNIELEQFENIKSKYGL
jgi:hypothetical protein